MVTDLLDAEDPDPFGARRLTADEVSALAGRTGLETEDAFVVERSAEVAAGT
ncbi:hypothetical protein [Nocardiopsis sp. CA-288880]|uniref:hypothetical protein n=1 Tax=Nocardiopsis sp. CA-288880 TaxID=3239995 RepID=UPI003D974A51